MVHIIALLGKVTAKIGEHGTEEVNVEREREATPLAMLVAPPTLRAIFMTLSEHLNQWSLSTEMYVPNVEYPVIGHTFVELVKKLSPPTKHIVKQEKLTMWNKKIKKMI